MAKKTGELTVDNKDSWRIFRIMSEFVEGFETLGCIGEATSEAITLDPVELAHALWVTRDEVKGILAGTHPSINAPRSGAIAGAIIAAWAAGQI